MAPRATARRWDAPLTGRASTPMLGPLMREALATLGTAARRRLPLPRLVAIALIAVALFTVTFGAPTSTGATGTGRTRTIRAPPASSSRRAASRSTAAPPRSRSPPSIRARGSLPRRRPPHPPSRSGASPPGAPPPPSKSGFGSRTGPRVRHRPGVKRPRSVAGAHPAPDNRAVARVRAASPRDRRTPRPSGRPRGPVLSGKSAVAPSGKVPGGTTAGIAPGGEMQRPTRRPRPRGRGVGTPGRARRGPRGEGVNGEVRTLKSSRAPGR